MIVWVLYCVIFPLSGVLHFVILAAVGLITFGVLSLIFPSKTVSIDATKEPERTGDENVDSLLAEGEKTVAEMRKLCVSIPDEKIKLKADELACITDRIFKKLLVEPGVYTQVKRFAEFFLPTTVKLLNSYDRFSQSGVEGENITGTMERIDTALDTSLESYRKFYDSLFESQALDIETDISVFDTMLKKEGLLSSDFQPSNAATAKTTETTASDAATTDTVKTTETTETDVATTDASPQA